MRLFYDTLPIIIFFTLYYTWNIFAATAGAMITSLGQVSLTLLQGKRPETSHWVSLITIFVLGSATLILRDEMFIKWKPTAVYWVLSLAFFGSQFIGAKPLIKRMLDKSIELPSKIWMILNFSWSAFFFTMGVINLFIVYNFSTQIWVNFKLFGSLGLTLFFVLIQGVFLSNYLPKTTENIQENSK